MKTDMLVANEFGIADVLKTLGIKETNAGACSGTQWLDTKGEIIESYSPADGALIGKIKQATT